MERLDVPKTFEELQARWAQITSKATGDSARQVHFAPSNPPDGEAGCDTCDGSGWYSNFQGFYVRCSCIVDKSSAPGVPFECHGLTLSKYEGRDGQQRAISKAQEFVDTRSRDLFFTGGVGAGKTRIACAVANDCYRKRLMVQFERVPLMLHQLQPGRDNSEFEARLMSVHVAVFDDIGAERDQATDYTRRTLLMLYEARHDRGLRTVFTSNKSIQGLAEMQDDDRLASRIAGRSDVVQLTTPDQRLRRVK